MRRSPAYIETPQIRLPPAVNISHQNIRGVHSEHTQNFIYPSLKCKWPIHTKLLAPNDLISLSYRTQYCVWNDNVYYELKKKIDWNILVLPDQCSRTFWASSRYRYRDTKKKLTTTTRVAGVTHITTHTSVRNARYSICLKIACIFFQNFTNFQMPWFALPQPKDSDTIWQGLSHNWLLVVAMLKLVRLTGRGWHLIYVRTSIRVALAVLRTPYFDRVYRGNPDLGWHIFTFRRWFDRAMPFALRDG